MYIQLLLPVPAAVSPHLPCRHSISLFNGITECFSFSSPPWVRLERKHSEQVSHGSKQEIRPVRFYISYTFRNSDGLQFATNLNLIWRRFAFAEGSPTTSINHQPTLKEVRWGAEVSQEKYLAVNISFLSFIVFQIKMKCFSSLQVNWRSFAIVVCWKCLVLMSSIVMFRTLLFIYLDEALI